MCLFVSLFFMAIGATAMYFGHNLGEFGTGIMLLLMGIGILLEAINLARPHHIDSSVNNKIIAHDGQGRYLVEAKTSRQIIGPRPHVNGNMPANLTRIKKGLWVVDRQGYQDNYDKTKWIPLSGYSLQPRGNTQTRGLLGDEMEGWEHNYIKKDGG